MLRQLLIIPAMMLIAHGGFSAAQERFELTVAGTTTRSTAELTASSLSINHQGDVSVYSRDTRYDIPGYIGFTSTALRQIIRWPSKGTGSMQVAKISQLRVPQFRQSQMQITRVAAPIRTLPSPASRGPVDTTRTYRLTNAFLGPNRCLDTDPRGTTAMAISGDFAAQSWRFVVAGAQTYRLMNVALGDGFSLTAYARDPRPAMERTDLRSRAQLWRLTSQGTAIRITNDALGTGWSLDNAGDGANEPILAASSNVTGQLWTLTQLATAKVDGIVGTWQEVSVATNQPVGITVEIQKNLAFRQTEPGKPDRLGLVQLVGDLLSLSNAGGNPEEFRVTVTADRIDFRELNGIPLGFFWRRTATGPLSPKPGPPRRISRTVVPKPALAPATIELANSHNEELWVLVNDLRDASRAQRLKIPSGKSVAVKLERDAGTRIVEVWETPTTGIQQQRESETPPIPLYEISVYELFVQSIYIDRTKKDAGRVEDINRVPKSVGLIKVLAGDGFKGGKTDIYTAAKRQKNPGAVQLIDPAKWR